MKRNLSKLDRMLRITLAAILILWILSYQIIGISAYMAGVLAFILITTALYSSCPLYSLFQISSKKE